MEPFCEIFMGESKDKTKCGEGKKPLWNEQFQYELRPVDHQLNIKVLEEDVTSNDNIGDCAFDLIPLLNNPGFAKQMLEIKD